VTDRETVWSQRNVVAGYVLLAMTPFVIGATHSAFWHSMAPLATALFVGLLAALVMRRRWAWALLVAFDAVVLISFVIYWTDVWAFVLTVASFALLVSSPMRRYVRRRTLTS